MRSMDDEARCREEIARAEQELRDGDPALDGLVRGLADWWMELRWFRARRNVDGTRGDEA